ncbi:MAG: hypothetical protein EA382_17790 [Spirochaetaceae bacterium]|nr:MAG: hypothetical protein EA382_17790 [Spirochaetaceae bacterium]
MANDIWYQKPLRVLQTVLRETDAIDYDADGVVRFMEQHGYDVLVVNGGGIFDFFPSPLPMANPNPFLGGRDLLGEISAACRSAGMRLIVRVDFRGVDKARYDAHPDWFSTDHTGGPVIGGYNSLPLYAPCYTGHYRNEHATQFISHILANYAVDGIWHNSVHVPHVCYCARCASVYAKHAGCAIPVEAEATEEEMDRYWAWKAICARENLARLRATVKEFGDERIYVAEVFSMFDVAQPKRVGIDLYEASEYFDFLVSVAFLTANRANPEWEPLSYAGSIVRFLRALDPTKKPVVLFGGNGTAYRYVMDPPVDLEVWLREATALGGGLWNCYFNGQHPGLTHDRRNAAVADAAYAFVKEHATDLTDLTPVRDVGLFYSKATKDRFGSDATEDDLAVTAMRGAEEVLIDEHIAYGFVPDHRFAAESLAGLPVLILPNVMCMSDDEAAVIRQYVAAGGAIVATHKTSLYSRDGEARSDFALADLFGCSYSGKDLDTNADSYQVIIDRSSPIVSATGDTDLLISGGVTARVTAADAKAVVCTATPRIPNQPPEKAWTQAMDSGIPTVIHRRFGSGAVVYFATQVDRLCWTSGHNDHRLLLANAVKTLIGSRRSLLTDAPPSVHLHLSRATERPGTLVLSAVNHTASAVRPLRSLVPVGPFTVRIATADPDRVRCRTLDADSAITASAVDGALELRFAGLATFAAVAIDGVE